MTLYMNAQKDFVIYIPESDLFLIQNNTITKILYKPIFIINRSNVDDYMIVRNFDKILIFNKTDVIFFKDIDHNTLKQEIQKAKSYIPVKTMYPLWVYLNLLEDKL